jgi:hypothetical protein
MSLTFVRSFIRNTRQWSRISYALQPTKAYRARTAEHFHADNSQNDFIVLSFSGADGGLRNITIYCVAYYLDPCSLKSQELD